jgi:acyl-ACP thioesterase
MTNNKRNFHKKTEEEKYVNSTWNYINYNIENINKIFENILCCYSTTSTHKHHDLFSEESYKKFEDLQKFDHKSNFYNNHHILKPRNVTYVGGKTTYGHRVSTIM